MLILLLLAAAFRSSSSIPVTSAIDALDPPTPLTIFGRQLPECLNPASQRTIQDIIWSCIATIFACTWVAVHPNVPKPCTSGWKKLKERVKIMVCALLAPELITAWALRQRIGAAKHMGEYNAKYFEEMPPARSIVQCLLDWFGEYDQQCHRHNRNGPWTLAHGFLLEMRGLRPYNRPDFLPRSGAFQDITKLPGRLSISEAEINDKSKGDFLTKLFVVLQTTWFIFQVLARWVTHLQVTELEVVTLGFAFLNIVTYGLWWNKPQNMQVPIYIDAGEEDTLGEGWHGTRVEEDNGADVWGRISRAPFKIAHFTITLPVMFVDMLADHGNSSFYSSVDGTENLAVLLPMTFINVIFGGLHFIPLWTLSFPSNPERVLWLISAVWITTEPILLTGVALADLDGSHGRFLQVIGYVMAIPMAVGGWLYVVARFLLITIAFTTLRDLSPSAYQNIEWTTFIPHF